MAKQATLTPSGQGKASRRVPSIPEYVQECRAELRKVHWPTREETTQLTVAVIVMTVAIAVFLGLIDEVLLKLISHVAGTS